MRCAVILHSPIGGGKTTTAQTAVERAKAEGIKVMGILSKRVIDERGYTNYNLLELDTGATMPLVKPASRELDEDWESCGNPKYVFSKKGLYFANLALERAAMEMRDGIVVFVDEYGRLESQHKGIHHGALMVADALKQGGIAVYLCRDDKVQEITSLLHERTISVFVLKAGDADALFTIIRKCSRL